MLQHRSAVCKKFVLLTLCAASGRGPIRNRVSVQTRLPISRGPTLAANSLCAGREKRYDTRMRGPNRELWFILYLERCARKVFRSLLVDPGSCKGHRQIEEPAMKRLLKIVGGLFVCLALLLIVLRITRLNPHGGIPGLWLTGDLVTTPVTDWSFTDKVSTIKLPTQGRFLLPHSVTINCLAYNSQLYVTSVYPAGPPRSWNENVMRDPHVRIKIGDKLYDSPL